MCAPPTSLPVLGRRRCFSPVKVPALFRRCRHLLNKRCQARPTGVVVGARGHVRVRTWVGVCVLTADVSLSLGGGGDARSPRCRPGGPDPSILFLPASSTFHLSASDDGCAMCVCVVARPSFFAEGALSLSSPSEDSDREEESAPGQASSEPDRCHGAVRRKDAGKARWRITYKKPFVCVCVCVGDLGRMKTILR